VAYSYGSRDPRGRLREVTTQWLDKMKVHGQSPNREVMFGPEPTDQTVPARGYLLHDGRSESGGYLVLEDGDVLDMREEEWMSAPDDQLVRVLCHSITDAMYRRQGHFAIGSDVQWVPDRRGVRRPFMGPDRRGYY